MPSIIVVNKKASISDHRAEIMWSLEVAEFGNFELMTVQFIVGSIAEQKFCWSILRRFAFVLEFADQNFPLDWDTTWSHSVISFSIQWATHAACRLWSFFSFSSCVPSLSPLSHSIAARRLLWRTCRQNGERNWVGQAHQIVLGLGSSVSSAMSMDCTNSIPLWHENSWHSLSFYHCSLEDTFRAETFLAVTLLEQSLRVSVNSHTFVFCMSSSTAWHRCYFP